MTTHIIRSATVRSLWWDASACVSLLSLLSILAHVVLPPVTGTAIPYAGGAAVILGIGATLSLGLKSRSTRLAASAAMTLLLSLRILSALRPDLLVARNGNLSGLDAAVLAVLAVASVVLVGIAWTTTTSESDPSARPSGAANG